MLKVKELKYLVFHWFIFCILVSVNLYTILVAKQKDFIYFNTEDVDQPDRQAPLIQPWKIVRLDPDYGGQWILAADLNGDGAVNIVSAENFNKGDVHYTTTAVVQNLDGSVVWQWGNPDIGRKNWHHDVACQIHDWNGDNQGRRIGTFNTPGAETPDGTLKYEKSMLTGDMTGDGIPDVILTTPYAVYIYENKSGRKPDRPVRLGTEQNLTLY